MMIASRYILACLACSVAFGIQSQAATDTAPHDFGCKFLEQKADPQSIIGQDGFVFRVHTDLRLHHTFTDQTVTNLAHLSKWLKQNGTTLIYAPVPTKSQAMPDYLPQTAKLYGYDDRISSVVYEDIIDRLKAAGVVTVDLMTALRAAEPGKEPFFKADFHWSPEGARLAAKAISETIKAQPEYQQVTKTHFQTVARPKTPLFSKMRNNLQRYCKESLPAINSVTYQTQEAGGSSQGATLDLFGPQEADPIALVGTSFSDAQYYNFAGFIRQYSSLRLTNYSVTGGNQFGSMLSYLTSNDFKTSRPKFIIWENPIYNNLGQFGAAPWVELWASARQECVSTAANLKDGGKETFLDNLSRRSLQEDLAILVDSDDTSIRSVNVKVDYASGRSRNITIERNSRIRSTGRFYMPVRPIAHEQISQLTIDFSKPSDGVPIVQLCSY